MNIKKLFEMQKVLDERIEQEHPVKVGENRFSKKILALQIEIGELANELPEIFKFWANKKNKPDKALKEYVDGLHFLLSIGNDLEFSNCEIWEMAYEKTLENQFNEVFRKVNTLYFLNRVSVIGLNDYECTLASYLTLGKAIGFKPEEIEQAYMDKNKVNHQRQDNGY
ncbi:hypothetical protein CHH83_05775 [Bacillus sp. 7586-K]|nr:hypothetical protein CHH83_05775 [Bacillus sp. 7586-K]